MSEDATTWTEVCKKVRFGDTLYTTCREKVKDYPAGGFAGGAFDEVPDRDFETQISRSALKIPDPPNQEMLKKYPPGSSERPELFGMPLDKILVYGGVAFLVWILLLNKKQPVATTETASAPSDVTSDKAA